MKFSTTALALTFGTWGAVATGAELVARETRVTTPDGVSLCTCARWELEVRSWWRRLPRFMAPSSIDSADLRAWCSTIHADAVARMP